MNVLICGLGAIGTIYAHAMQKRTNLKILVDKGRLEKYSKNPAKFNEEVLKLDYVLPEENNFKADLIIIATKFDGLKDAIKNIENFVLKDTIIMSLLNGITSEKLIAQKYGSEKVLYSYFIGHSAVRKGRNVTQDGVNRIVFGAPFETKNIEKVRKIFDETHINYEIPDDIIYSMWLKFMLNVSSNQTSAILRMTFGEMQNNEKCMRFLTEIMKEVERIAKAEGVKNTEKMTDEALSVFKTMSADGKTSMLQDIEAGRKTEVEIFAGTIIELGEKHNIPTPYNRFIYELISIMDA